MFRKRKFVRALARNTKFHCKDDKLEKVIQKQWNNLFTSFIDSERSIDKKYIKVAYTLIRLLKCSNAFNVIWHFEYLAFKKL